VQINAVGTEDEIFEKDGPIFFWLWYDVSSLLSFLACPIISCMLVKAFVYANDGVNLSCSWKMN
jgi:hypothetical protein